MIPGTAARQAPLSSTISRTLLKFTSIESLTPSHHLILRHPLLLPPSIFPSVWVFSNDLALRIRWPKYWSFSFSISPSSECSELISFGIDWLDLLAVQGTLTKGLELISGKLALEACESWHLRIGVESLSLKTPFSLPAFFSEVPFLRGPSPCHVMTLPCYWPISREVKVSRLVWPLSSWFFEVAGSEQHCLRGLLSQLSMYRGQHIWIYVSWKFWSIL